MCGILRKLIPHEKISFVEDPEKSEETKIGFSYFVIIEPLYLSEFWRYTGWSTNFATHITNERLYIWKSVLGNKYIIKHVWNVRIHFIGAQWVPLHTATATCLGGTDTDTLCPFLRIFLLIAWLWTFLALIFSDIRFQTHFILFGTTLFDNNV